MSGVRESESFVRRKTIRGIITLLCVVLLLVIGGIIVAKTSHRDFSGGGDSGVSQVDDGELSLTDKDKDALAKEKELGSRSQVGRQEARNVAVVWAQRWVNGSGKPLSTLTESLRDISSPELIDRMKNIDTFNIPEAGGVEGAAVIPGTNRGNIINFRVSFTSGMLLEVVLEQKEDQNWQVITYDRARRGN